MKKYYYYVTFDTGEGDANFKSGCDEVCLKDKIKSQKPLAVRIAKFRAETFGDYEFRNNSRKALVRDFITDTARYLSRLATGSPNNLQAYRRKAWKIYEDVRIGHKHDLIKLNGYWP